MGKMWSVLDGFPNPGPVLDFPMASAFPWLERTQPTQCFLPPPNSTWCWGYIFAPSVFAPQCQALGSVSQLEAEASSNSFSLLLSSAVPCHPLTLLCSLQHQQHTLQQDVSASSQHQYIGRTFPGHDLPVKDKVSLQKVHVLKSPILVPWQPGSAVICIWAPYLAAPPSTVLALASPVPRPWANRSPVPSPAPLLRGQLEEAVFCSKPWDFFWKSQLAGDGAAHGDWHGPNQPSTSCALPFSLCSSMPQ